MSSAEPSDSESPDAVKEATLVALQRVLDPLLELMLDAGVTVQEFTRLARDRAVRVAARRMTLETGRSSKARIAIVTGLPRSEVGRILNSRETIPTGNPEQQPARRVLAAWHDDPRYLAVTGDPAELPIFGKRRSFETLVEKYGLGLPVRAMLDELMQLHAVSLTDDQKVRAMVRVPVLTGLSSRSIMAVGERGRDLLETLAHNVHRAKQPFFEATAVVDDGDPELLTVVRRDIAEQGTNFITGAASLLNRSQTKRASRTAKQTRKCRFGVTVYYFEEVATDGEDAVSTVAEGRRKNLRRRERKLKGTGSE